MSDLMISVSGIRGIVGESLNPVNVSQFASAFGRFCNGNKVIIGRDSRVTGELMSHAVISGLLAVGNDVVNIGLSPTPTIQLAVSNLKASGAIAITASHNPVEWNGLKMIGADGFFLDSEQGEKVIQNFRELKWKYVRWDKMGHYERYDHSVQDHIDAILRLSFVNLERLHARKFKVVVDCVAGAGGMIMPNLLQALGCDVVELNCDPHGRFPRNPEPIPENLKELSDSVKKYRADIGFAVDPDVDRLAIVDEQGEPIGEEYSLALAVRYLLQKKPPVPVVTNVSTTRAIEDIAKEYNCPVVRTKVGEIHVAKKMREVKSVIGGEGNGGVMIPELHTGRDAPVAAAVTLQHLVEYGGKVSELHRQLPQYVITKKKIQLEGMDLDQIMRKIKELYYAEPLDFTDGIKINRKDSWIHLRKSNTEPVIRIITEARTRQESEAICMQFMDQIIKMK